MFSTQTIQHLELELSTHCNSFCPQCPRYLDNGEVLPGLNLGHLDFEIIKNLSDLPSLEIVKMCGGYGDPLMHPKIDDFIDLFQDKKIIISTNASMRNHEWWNRIGKQGITVIFCIDGMADTHGLYRINTNYEKIIANARSFIDAGGRAEWQMIVFEHNQHQVDECQSFATDIGFKKFYTVHSDRFDYNNSFRVYKDGEYSHTLEKSNQHTTLREEFGVEQGKKYSTHAIKEYLKNKQPIPCHWSKNKMIYIDADATVWPCCMMGTMKDKDDIHKNLFLKIIQDWQSISLKTHTLENILSSKVYNEYFVESINHNAHPMCIDHCHPEFGKYYRSQ